jgi:1-acyl-sn-glycerol-3-phosphate acyltransferase
MRRKHYFEHLTGHEPSLLSELADLGLRSFDPWSLENWDPALVAKLLPQLLRIRDRYYHGTVLGLEQLPEGPFMLVGAHGGGPMNVFGDNLVLFSSYYEATGVSRPLYATAHHIVFHLGPIGRLMAKFGAIDGNPKTARTALRNGQGVVVFPGGEEDMARTYWHRNQINFRGHTGFARLALEEGVPIFPLAELGGHETEFVLTPGYKLAKALFLPKLVGLRTFPIALTIPWGITIGYLPYIPLPTHIVQKIGAPLVFKPSEAEKSDKGYIKHVAHEVESAVQRLTYELVAEFEACGVPAKS